MTQEEILEYNKRCAEFLTITNGYFPEEIEAKNQQFSHLCTYANTAYAFDKDAEPNKTAWDYLEFHSDWNWIMEVVEAIEKLKGVSVYVGKNRMNKLHSVEISYEDNTWIKKPHIDRTIFIQNESKKESVVQAINQFLKWYNDNTNK